MWRGFDRSGARFACLLLALLLVGLVGCSSDSAGREVDPEQGQVAEADADADAGRTGEDDSNPEGEQASGEDEEPEPEKQRKERATAVTAAPVILGELVVPVIAEGSIRARNATEIKFELSARVSGIWIKEGQRVKKGQKLVSLDDREYQLALEEAEARYLQALGQLAVEEEGYDQEAAVRTLTERRAELAKLEREGVITRDERLDRELDLGMEAVRNGAYRRELLEVRSGLAAARADATRARLNIERTVLTAPFTGVITDLELNPGERVQTGQSFCRLVDDVNVEAAVGVLESDLGALSVGRPALLTIPALTGLLQVQVDVISPDVDEDSRTCRVLLRVHNRDGRVKPGMFVRAAIAGEIYEQRLLVPTEAILTRDGRPVIFRVEGDRAKWVYVQLGQRNDHLVEITRIDQGGPLDPGTLVVVDNHLTLTHDAKIKVRQEIETRDPWARLDDEQG